MNTKEKAKQLFNKFMKPVDELHKYPMCFDTAKQCAIIAVDEILENVDYFFNELEKDNLPNKFGDEIEYWESVKYEIKKL